MGDTYVLGVIGAGAMGGALVRGFIANGALRGDQIIVSDVREDLLAGLADANGVATTTDNQRLIDSSSALLIALKPQVIQVVLEPLVFPADQLIISIAAGVSLNKLAALTSLQQPLVRVMPNMLATISEGAAAYAGSALVSAEQLALVARLLGSVGTAVAVEEKLMDAVTGLSGSGPAFVALFAEAFIDGGVAAGLPRADAVRLAAQTILGVGRWLLETESSPAVLKDLVTSPGGTTISGVRTLEQGGLRSAVIEAVVAATQRSRELGG